MLREFADDGMERFNDVIADPEGRVFAGTIGRTPMSGGLHRVEPDGTATLLFRGTGCSNGMGFSPDLRKFYWTCSTRRRIYEFDYGRATGTHRRRASAVSGQRRGRDSRRDDRRSRGHIWSARWDGGAVVHHAPDGRVLEKFPFPVAKVSRFASAGRTSISSS